MSVKPKRRRIRSRRISKRSNPNKWKILIVLLFIISQLIFFNSSLFKLGSVEIQGNEKIPQEKVLAAIGITPHSNINLLTLNMKEIKKKLESMVWVKDIDIYCLPGKIKICLKERNAAFFVMSEKFPGQWFVVDEEGRVLEKATKPMRKEIPRIVLSYSVRPKDTLNPALVESLKRWNKLFDSKSQEKIKSILIAFEADDRNNLSLRCWYQKSLLKIILGKARAKFNHDELCDMEKRLNKLSPLIELLESKNKKITSVDLRSSDPVIDVEGVNN